VQTPIDIAESMVTQGAEDIFAEVKRVMDSLGARAFMKKKMSEEDELVAYQALRNTQAGLYHYADGIRMDFETRLGLYSAEERLALGVGDSEVRRIAYLLALMYMKRMNRLSEKLGIPIEGLEPVPDEPLPPVGVEPGGEPWPGMMTSPESLIPLSPESMSLPPPPEEVPLYPEDPFLPLPQPTLSPPLPPPPTQTAI